jgi:toxin ParE1/3/4
MSRLRFSRRAQHDLDAIADYIEQRDAAAAERWVDLIEARCRLLADQPRLGRRRDDLRQNLRSLAVGNYLIFYRPIRGGVEIVRVLHGKRDLAALFTTRDGRR